MKIDVIIPTYKPDKRFFELLKRLHTQELPVNKVIVMNTEEKYMDNLMYGHAFGDERKLLKIHHIGKIDFDHGQTRNAGAAYSDADVIVFMTQDAMPVDNNLTQELIKALEKDKVAAAYARQIAYEEASVKEKFSREFNYPDEDQVKSLDDIETLGIKAFFCSNVCAAYKKSVFDELGGFVNKAIFNEDMVYANKLLKNDYKVAYASKAIVRHSHDYSNKQQFKRNFDIAVSQEMHKEVFEGVSSESEGVKYVKSAFAYFVKERKPLLIVPFGIGCVYRLLGFKLGKKYKSIPKRIVLKLSMNPRFFMKYWNTLL